MHYTKTPEKLPDYVVITEVRSKEPKVLRTPAKELTFPLSMEDQRDIAILEQKFDQEENCAGLAAPQIGIHKRVIIFALEDDPILKKWRPDLTDTMPKSVWINPSYEPVGQERHEDYEACFSGGGLAGPVQRYKHIRYKAYDKQGNLIQGEARGFLARMIQHETDHVHGRLFVDLVPDDQLLTIDEYRRRRAEAMGKDID